MLATPGICNSIQATVYRLEVQSKGRIFAHLHLSETTPSRKTTCLRLQIPLHLEEPAVLEHVEPHRKSRGGKHALPTEVSGGQDPN